MKYKAVIFDFDYTLGDCTEGIAASVNHGLKKLGYEAGELEDIRKTIGWKIIIINNPVRINCPYLFFILSDRGLVCNLKPSACTIIRSRHPVLSTGKGQIVKGQIRYMD